MAGSNSDIPKEDIPPDAAWTACFGIPASDAAFAAWSAGDAEAMVAAVAAAAGRCAIPLPTHAPREGCALPEDLAAQHDRLGALLSEAARLARLDRIAQACSEEAGETSQAPSVPCRLLRLGSSGRSRIVREALGIEEDWELPGSALLRLANVPGAALYRVDASFVTPAAVMDHAKDAVAEGIRGAGFPFEAVLGPDPRGFSLRLAACREAGAQSLYRRSAASWLSSRVAEAIETLPAGAFTRDACGRPVAWRYAARTREAAAAALARLSGPGPGHACVDLAVSGPFAEVSSLWLELPAEGAECPASLNDALAGAGA